MDSPLILITDDQVDNVDLLEQRLEGAGFRTAAAYDGEEAVERVQELNPDLLLLDLTMPKLDGIATIRILRERPEYQDLPIIVFTARGELEDRVAGLDAGADEYLVKPIDETELLARVRAMLRMHDALQARHRLEQENQQLRREMAVRDGFGEMIGRSAAMQEVYRLIHKVSQTSVSVLIEGETGTGKELVGRAIHRQSERRDNSFIAVNCGALPENLLESELFGHRKGSFTGADADRVGLFEAASGGTLFLDEIGDVPPATQVRLLRAVQEGEITRVGETHTRAIDTRVISATNKNLQTEVQEGRFREDLFFRLNVIPIRLPGLRERREDILDLAAHFLQRHCEHYNRPVPTLDAGARRCLVGYDWPGNVRELEHEMERAVTLMDPGADLTADSLLVDARQRKSTDGHGLGSGSLKEQMARIEAGLLREALERNNGNQTRTADQLAITRQGLIKKLQRYGLQGGRGAR